LDDQKFKNEHALSNLTDYNQVSRLISA